MFAQNKYARFWVEEKILIFEYKPDIFLNLRAAQTIVRNRLKLQNEKSFPILCDLRMVGESDKAGREYLAHEGSALAKAVALLVEPPFSQALGNLYINTTDPRIPTEVFTVRFHALNFLRHYT